MIKNIRALIEAAKILQVPILGTEQEKLGETVPELKTLLPGTPTQKLTFSCFDSGEFKSKLKATGRDTVIACGIETHICVMQTVLDLLVWRHKVMVARDATSSHDPIDRDTAIRRMESSGAMISTSEAIIYELMEQAGTDDFRRILDIVKERRTTSEENLNRGT
jgi:nicotinamidase-related amidase